MSLTTEPPDSNEPLIGRSVGNYRVERRLGAGGMGAVYLLRHTLLPNTFAAIKVMRDLDAAGSMKERFEQEAIIAAAIGSHRVVKPLDVGRFDDGTPFILMEYVPGRSLQDELRSSGPLPLKTALKIVWRIADTMVIAHRAGIIHRDLKPANIMLVEEGGKDYGVKLLDFGVARASKELKVVETAEKMVIGTSGYMSPESVAGLSVDGRADVFSLGVILYEVLCRELPFPAPSATAYVANVLTKPVPSLREHRPRGLDVVPPRVEALIRRALEKEPAQRHTMSAFHSELAQLLPNVSDSDASSTRMSGLAPLLGDDPTAQTLSDDAEKVSGLLAKLQAATGPGTSEPPSTRARKRPWLIGGLAAMVAVGVAVMYLVFRTAEPPVASAPSPAVAPPPPAPTAVGAVVATPPPTAPPEAASSGSAAPAAAPPAPVGDAKRKSKEVRHGGKTKGPGGEPIAQGEAVKGKTEPKQGVNAPAPSPASAGAAAIDKKAVGEKDKVGKAVGDGRLDVLGSEGN